MVRTRSGDLDALGVRPVRLRATDLLTEAGLSVARHPGRSMLTAVGTVLGAAAFVATLGLSSTLSAQVSETFDLQRATEVSVRVREGAEPPDAAWQRPDALARLTRLNGVVAAGSRLLLAESDLRRSADPSAPAVAVAVAGADPGALDVIEPRLVTGRLPDGFHERTASPVVLLPAATARQLSITRVGVAVFLDDRPYTVLGIFDDVGRRTDALLTVIMPLRTAEALVPPEVATGGLGRDVVIETAPGAAVLIGRQAPLALRPEGPEALESTAPPDLQSLRRTVEEDITRLSLVLSVVALVIGAVSIGNAATAGVAARTPEIGLRRAVGGRPRHIFVQLVAETTALGAVGGLVGALVGVLVTSTVSLVNGWLPVIDVSLGLVAAAGGAAAGLLAGLVPAMRAMRIPPVAALQR